MDLVLAGLGMLACLAITVVLMPLGMRVARRVRRATANHAAASTSGSRDAPRTLTMQAMQARTTGRARRGTTAVWTSLGPASTAPLSRVGGG
jgi:hypothetical protein